MFHPTTLKVFFTIFILEYYVEAYELPENVLPENYQLEITTNLDDDGYDKFTFQGKVTIKVHCVEPTNKIVLNAHNLTIDDKKIKIQEFEKKKEFTQVEDTKYDHDNESYAISLKDSLKKDQTYDLTLEFSGKITDSLVGYYRSSYFDSKANKKKWLSVTQFEPTSARMAFPCFDEPNMKATFEIKLGRLGKYHSLSNMPLVSTEPMEERKGWFWDTFEKSVPMSTYLVAYMVSDFNYTLAPQLPNSKVIFKIWSKEEAISKMDFASEVGPLSLKFFENFFKINYPLPKLDMVAIPDFDSGAMENWGLITYREYLLEYDPKVSTFNNKFQMASTIAHEIAHQWFGNLVTMKWWTDLWLNEGFATYMSALALDQIYPKWKALQEETVDNLIAVLGFDSLKSSHPVSVPIKNSKYITEIFDTISYSKGSYLLYMMASFLGEETFKQGVSKYLEKHKYKNAEQDDLWESLTKQAHQAGTLPKNMTVKEIMDTWTLQTGYPVVEVTRNYEDGSAKVSQARYLRDATAEEKTCWRVPLSYTTKSENNFNDKQPKQWMYCPLNTITINNIGKKDDWVLFNIQASGLYRVNYDEKNWNMLISTLNSDSFDKLPILNRVLLIEDSADFASTKKLDYEFFFKIIPYLSRENEYLPWNTALTNIGYLNNMLRNTDTSATFKRFIRRIIAPAYQRILPTTFDNVEEDNNNEIRLKSTIFAQSCKYELETCLKDAAELFQTYINNSDKNNIPVNIRRTVYCQGIKAGGEKEWNFLWNKYKHAKDAGEKNIILPTLGCSKNIKTLDHFLQLSISDDSGIRKQDSTTAFQAVANSEIGFPIARDFFFKNINKIHDNLKLNKNKLTRYLKSIAQRTTSEEEYNQLKQFVDEHKEIFDDLRNGVNQALESAELNVQWQKNHAKTVQNYFLKHHNSRKHNKHCSKKHFRNKRRRRVTHSRRKLKLKPVN